MDATIRATARWKRFDRVLVVVLLAAFSLGIPGLGVETRQVENTAVLTLAYSLGFLAPLAALGASWRWPRAAAALGLVGGLTTLVLALLDLAGVMAGAPPLGMVVVNAVVALLAAVLSWRTWLLLRT